MSGTMTWTYDAGRRRWEKRYEGGSVAAVVHRALTPGEQRAARDGWIVSVYRPGKGEGRIATTGSAPKETDGCRMADAILGAIAQEKP